MHSLMHSLMHLLMHSLMHLVGDREGLLPECSAGYLELRRLKLKHTWQLTPCLLQIINGRLSTGSTNFNHDGGQAVTSGRNYGPCLNSTYKRQKFSSYHDFSVYEYAATLRVAALAVDIRMRYLAGEDLSTYLLVHDKSCFVQ